MNMLASLHLRKRVSLHTSLTDQLHTYCKPPWTCSTVPDWKTLSCWEKFLIQVLYKPMDATHGCFHIHCSLSLLTQNQVEAIVRHIAQSICSQVSPSEVYCPFAGIHLITKLHSHANNSWYSWHLLVLVISWHLLVATCQYPGVVLILLLLLGVPSE